MQETKNSSWYSTVAGALFALGGVVQLFFWLWLRSPYLSALYHIQNLIWVASYVVLAFALLAKRRDIFLPVGFALRSLACLFNLSFTKVLLLLGNLGMAFLAVVFVTDFLPQFREQMKKLWFVPPCGSSAFHASVDARCLDCEHPKSACYMRWFIPGGHVGRLPRRTPSADGERIRRNRKHYGRSRS